MIHCARLLSFLLRQLFSNLISVLLLASHNTSLIRKRDLQQIQDLSNKMALSEKTDKWFKEVESERLKAYTRALDKVISKCVFVWRVTEP